jgi:hypothetical protein
MQSSANSAIAPASKNATQRSTAQRGPRFFTFCASFRTLPLLSLLLLTPFSGGVLRAQTPVTTWHYNNERTSANTTEFLLTPSNVNTRTFGKLFSQPVDGFVVGHPLYLPGITIPGQGTHNVVYVATMHDSVYAFDADRASSSPLWMTSILTYSPAGATTVPATVQKNAGTTGWSEVGIISTPVIDQASGTLYLVAETYENGKVVHRLHALDVSSGLEKLGGPTTIAATYTLNGVVSTFQDLYQINRPGLLLANGHIYIAFGSNCCNDYSQGWVMSYNASTLQQEGTFDTEPGATLASVWQKGAGISADSSGNIYAETGEGFYAPGTNLSTSVFKLSQIGTTLSLADWFTPFNHQFLSTYDWDMAQAVVILPDQPGPFPHELIAVGKEGTVYVLNRDNMGHLCSACTAADTQIVQELLQAAGPEGGTPVYWNNTVYFTGAGLSVVAYSLSNGSLMVPPLASPAKYGGGGHALITANGNSNGILWFMSGGTFWAMDAPTLHPLYNSLQAAGGGDVVPPLAHFATPIAADGKVFIGTQNSLVVYGLFPALSVVGGNGQSAIVASTLPRPLAVQAVDPYTQNVFPGLTVTFSDSGKGGILNPSTVIIDPTGSASSFYTLPSKSGPYMVTASAPGYGVGLFTETALPALPDLTEASLTNPPATALDGSTFSVTDTVQNIGNVTAATSITRYYLSTTTSKSGAHMLTGSRAVPALAPGATSSGTVTVTVSAGTAGGIYFLLACADDTFLVPEINETNNCKASAAQVTVSGPDLVETAVNNPPTAVTPGGTFSVTDTVQNIGNVTAATSITHYYLSTTTSKSGAHVLSGNRAVSALAPGATSSGTVTAKVFAGTAGGTYFLLACADDTFLVPETNEGNNCKASATQVTVSGPDLGETAVSNPPTAVTPGGTFSVTDTVQNIGNVTAATSVTRYYLSTTTSKSASSILLIGSRSIPSLVAAATSSGNASVTVPSTLANGIYFLLACADATSLVSETNESNNCRASATTTAH